MWHKWNKWLILSIKIIIKVLTFSILSSVSKKSKSKGVKLFTFSGSSKFEIASILSQTKGLSSFPGPPWSIALKRYKRILFRNSPSTCVCPSPESSWTCLLACWGEGRWRRPVWRWDESVRFYFPFIQQGTKQTRSY